MYCMSDAEQTAKTKTLPQKDTDTDAIKTPHDESESSNAALKSHRSIKIGAIIITVLTLALVVFFGFQLFTDTGVFHEPGKVLFGENMSEVDHDFIQTNLDNIELGSDVTISASSSFDKLPTSSAHVLYDILVPVTDFGTGSSTISQDEVKNANLISIWDLNFTKKLLAIDNDYYLDTFDSGAIFQYYDLSGAEEDVARVNEKLSQSIANFPDRDTVFTFAQTGVTALSREMNLKLNQVGDGAYFAKNIGSLLSSFDKTHTSNESSFSTNAPSDSHTSTICSLPGMIDTLTSIGVDIIELTGNHNQDCGDQAALDTIAKYQELGIETVGGGKTAAEAAIPLKISEKGTNITMLAYNLSTGGYTLDATPGANFYTEEKALADIASAKERGDFIIIDIQFNECNSYVNTKEDTTCDYADSSAAYTGHGSQSTFFRHLIDLGANVVVGTSAHQPQTFELYGDGAIYYGLGNLFFDQTWWPGTTRSLVLVHYFYKGELLQTRIIPTVYDSTYQTKLMNTDAAASFIDRLYSARPGEQ